MQNNFAMNIFNNKKENEINPKEESFNSSNSSSNVCLTSSIRSSGALEEQSCKNKKLKISEKVN
jgi:hypothetical protein